MRVDNRANKIQKDQKKKTTPSITEELSDKDMNKLRQKSVKEAALTEEVLQDCQNRGRYM